MGRPKALLDLAGEPLVAYVARVLLATCDELVLAVAPSEVAPAGFIAALESAVGGGDPAVARRLVVARDSDPFRGPVAGLASGLGAARGRLAVAVACDTPLLARPLIEGLFAWADSPSEFDVVLPVRGDRPEPLLAVYRVATAAPHFARRLALGGGRPTDGLESLRVRTVTEAEVRELDPAEASFANVNEPADYEALRARIARVATEPGSLPERSRRGSNGDG
jgi:molybdopterin-guanine dinucleotide biosynthesis protein A